MTTAMLTRRAILKSTGSTAVLACLAGPALARSAFVKDAFIERLIAAMSLEEKAGQLSIFADNTRGDGGGVNPETHIRAKDQLKSDIAKGLLTGVFNGIGVAGARELQKVAVEQAPHAIPLIFAADVLYGARTVFPIPVGEAASFDPDLAMRTARASAIETSALGIHWTFAPMVDVARDQRWGRVLEGAGEDPYLGSLMAAARVRGFQGRRLTDEDSVLACPKHFAGYGGVAGGMDYGSVDISEIALRQVFLPPFKAAFDAGALSTMSSFNDIAGVPATGNRHLLTDILRGEWKFGGLVVSDYTSEEELIAHGYATDGADAVRKAIIAGCDISMQSGLYIKHLPRLVRDGVIPLAVVDESVRRVLRVKKMLGLFDNPYRSLSEERERTQIRLPETVALARESARRSVVLLKNDGGLLPLPKSGKKIALIGPFGPDRDNLMGSWAIFSDTKTAVSVEDGLRAALPDPNLLAVVRGSDVDAPLEGGIVAAVAAAAKADVVILAVGESTGMSGESQSRTEIIVPKAQQDLAEAVAAVGKPMVVLLRHGRALALSGAIRNAQAIMATWFLGSETGHALADLIFGDASPSGRLPISFPLVSGQEPFFYNHRSSGRPQTVAGESLFKNRYREVPNEALYPFGHGLTYGEVRYGATTLSAEALSWDGDIEVRADVVNTGSVSVHEVAQLYIHDVVASVTQPVRALKGICRLDLKVGESRTVSFRLTRADLAFVSSRLQWEVEPGAFDVWIAPSATGGASARFHLADAPQPESRKAQKLRHSRRHGSH